MCNRKDKWKRDANLQINFVRNERPDVVFLFATTFGQVGPKFHCKYGYLELFPIAAVFTAQIVNKVKGAKRLCNPWLYFWFALFCGVQWGGVEKEYMCWNLPFENPLVARALRRDNWVVIQYHFSSLLKAQKANNVKKKGMGNIPFHFMVSEKGLQQVKEHMAEAGTINRSAFFRKNAMMKCGSCCLT